MTTPIPNCPQPETPIRERAWTDGQRSAEPKYSDAEDRLGAWMAAALDDPKVCAEMKADINRWFAFMASRPSTPDKAGVSDEDVHGAIEAYVLSHDNVSVPRFESMRAALTHFASHSAEAVRDGEIEIRLFDSQWVNVVNHADCYAGMSKEDAVAKAIKLTEVEMARNFHEDKWPKKAAKEQSHD